MSKGNQFSFALVDSLAAVDAENGVIRGVAVITEGPARGHFDWDSGKPLYADAETLREVMECAKTYVGGLKVKMNHGSGVGDIVGRLDNFRIEGTVLRADFMALATSAQRGYIFEIAQTMPDAFGLSISFSGTPKVDDKRAYARCTEIYSADFVDEPAANPTGLFQRGAGNGAAQPKQPNSKTNMEDDKKPDPIADLSASVASLIARLEKLEAVNSGEGDKKESSEEAMAALAEKTALAALKEYTKQFGAPPAAPSGETKREEKKPEKNFEAVVAEKAVELKSKAAAIKFAVAAHPELHKDYLARLSAGQVINL
jgi:hypothetical protein